MIQFKHVNKFTCCPHCKTTKVNRLEYRGTHTNGEQFELLQFSCYYTIEYIPNFSRFEERELCNKSEKARQIERTTKKIQEEIIKVLENNGAEHVLLVNPVRSLAVETMRLLQRKHQNERL